MNGGGIQGKQHTHPNLRAGHIQLYHLCDEASGWLIVAMVVLSPWLFGTTQPGVIRAMNVLGISLAGLLGVKLYIRRIRGFQPCQWVANGAHSGLLWLTRSLGALTLLLLAWCATSALNARAVWLPEAASFSYFDSVSWLPHSLDRTSTWQTFWNCAALAGFFWAVVDWLPGVTRREEQAQRRTDQGEPLLSTEPSAPLPGRLRALLWVLCLNGALLGLQGIVQRICGTGELLWLLEPRVNKGAETFFGPYAYRSNAAQYFNLVWPVCLGLWWTLHRTWGFRRWTHQWLLISAIIMAACPVISTTRGGALVMFGQLGVAGLIMILSPALLRAKPRQSPGASLMTFSLVCLFLAGSIWLALVLGWEALEPRMTEIEAGYVQREAMYETASRMVEDYPLLGVGPGAFEPVFQLYRGSTADYWPAQLHNDWMELRITFGGLGFGMIGLALILVLGRWWVPGGIHGGRRFVMLIWVALAGALVHARFDFPFRIYSVVLLFLLLGAVLFVVSCRGSKPLS